MNTDMMIPSYFGGYGPPARFRARNNPVDAKNYDFRANRSFASSPNNIPESVFHMLMFGLGGGLVVLHEAYMECGIWTALGLNLALAPLIGYCGCTLIWSAQRLYGRVQMPTLTYPDIMEATVLLSPWRRFRKTARCLRYLIEVTLMVNLYGSCCVLIIMIARNLKELVSGDSTINDTDVPPLKVYILSLMVPCIVICMVTDLKILAPFALICDLFAVVLIVIILWYAFHNYKDSPLDRAPFRSVMGTFEFISVCTFVLEPVSYALPIENNMDEPKKFPYVMMLAMTTNALAMATVGFVGFWHYGNFAVSPITVHLPYSPWAVTLKVALCIILYVIYSMCFYVAFDLEWFYLKRNHQMSNYWFWERLYRTLHVVVLTLIAFALPNVTRMMGILGAFTTCPSVYIYPHFIEVILVWEHPGLGRYKWRLIRCIAMLLFGFGVLFTGTFYNGLGMYLEFQITAKANMSFTPDEQNPLYAFSAQNSKNNPVYSDLQRKDIDFNLNYSNKNILPALYLLNISLPLTGHGIRNYDLNSLLPYNITNNLLPDQNNNLNSSIDNLLTDQNNNLNSSIDNTAHNLVNNNFNLINIFTTTLPRAKVTDTINILPENKNIIINIILPDINNFTVLFNNTTPLP